MLLLIDLFVNGGLVGRARPHTHFTYSLHHVQGDREEIFHHILSDIAFFLTYDMSHGNRSVGEKMVLHSRVGAGY